MHIFISNDDGVTARGIILLADVARELGTVTVVAPDREQSATSHSLTLHRPLRATRQPDGSVSVDGTPTDCVLLGLGAYTESKPDFLFSGVNHGPNMGEDVLYSGTVAAAMEGLAARIPSVAISFGGRDLDVMDTYRDTLKGLLEQIVSVPEFPAETLLNINLPAVPADQAKGVRVTQLGSRVFSGEIQQMPDPWGRPMYWIGGGRMAISARTGSDFTAIAEDYISVTPLHVDLTNYSLLEVVRGWKLDV